MWNGRAYVDVKVRWQAASRLCLSFLSQAVFKGQHVSTNLGNKACFAYACGASVCSNAHVGMCKS